MGCYVFANCYTQKGADDLSKGSKNIKTIVFDVTDLKKIVEACEQVEKELAGKPLWCVINNAGIAMGLPAEVMPLEDLRKVMEVNFFGTAMVCRTFLPLLRRSTVTPGRIINIASVAGRLSGPGLSAYSASKYAVEGYTDAMRREVMHFGVDVTLIEPGFMKTPMVVQALQQTMARWEKLEPGHRAAYAFMRERLENETKDNQEIASEDPQIVVDDVVRTVIARWPLVRILSGKGALIVHCLLANAPAYISDLIFRTGILEKLGHRRRTD